MSKPRTIALGLILLVLAAVTAGGFYLRHLLYDPAAAGADGVAVKFSVEKGEKLDSISRRLFEAGLIIDVTSLKLAVFFHGGNNRIKAGTHELPTGLNAWELLDYLSQSPPREFHVLTIPEGWDSFEIAHEAEGLSLCSAREFLAATHDAGAIRDLSPNAVSLEGYLFPDTYHVPVGATIEEMVAMMLERSRSVLDAGLQSEFAAAGLSPAEGVVLASLIAKEAGNEDEMPLISSVFHNRLRIGMKLDCDPTFIYASKLAGEWDGRIDEKDSTRDSLYNTYRYRGLPPGPIGNPGRDALLAAARPAETEYIYFVARSTDRTAGHYFSATYREHLRNINRYRMAKREATAPGANAATDSGNGRRNGAAEGKQRRR